MLFVDEIHRLNRQVEEVLYPGDGGFCHRYHAGKGFMPPAPSDWIFRNLPWWEQQPRVGLLTAPLRDRFGVIQRLEFYTPEELCVIVKRSAKVLGVEIDEEGACEIARRSRGTPRLANRLLKRVRDFAQVKYDGVITRHVADFALDILDVDQLGLDNNDRTLLLTLIQKFSGGPVGLETLAASIGEDSGTLEDVYEPYLIDERAHQRGRRGAGWRRRLAYKFISGWMRRDGGEDSCSMRGRISELTKSVR